MKRRENAHYAIVGLMLALVAWVQSPVSAHDPLMSSHFLTGKSGLDGQTPHWQLNMNFAQAGLSAAMTKRFGQQPLRKLDPKQLEAAALQYVRQSVTIYAFGQSFGSRAARLRFTGGALGSHHSLLTFVLEDVPEDTRSLSVRIEAGSENEGHTNLLFTKIDGRETRASLRSGNSWETTIEVVPAITAPAGRPWWHWGLGSAGVAAVAACIVFLLRRATDAPRADAIAGQREA